MLDLERPRAGAGDHLHVDLPGLDEHGEPDPVDGAGLDTGQDMPRRDLRASVRRVMAMPALARRLVRDRDAEPGPGRPVRFETTFGPSRGGTARRARGQENCDWSHA